MDNSTIDYLNQQYEIYKVDLSDIDLDDFAVSFAPFIHLVNFWSQLLALVISKSSKPALRKKIIKYLYKANCDELSQVDTFKLFINECQNNKLASFIKEVNLHLDSDNQIKQNLSIDTEIFESNPLISTYKISILNFIETNDFNDCCQMLGAIEYIYHLISKDINYYYKLQTNSDPSYHYTADKVLDISHSNDLFECNSKLINEENLEFGIKWITNCIRTLIMI